MTSIYFLKCQHYNFGHSRGKPALCTPCIRLVFRWTFTYIATDDIYIQVHVNLHGGGLEAAVQQIQQEMIDAGITVTAESDDLINQVAEEYANGSRKVSTPYHMLQSFKDIIHTHSPSE